MSSLDLALIGNGAIGVLLDSSADMVWGCFPRFDGDPVFCSLLRERGSQEDFGFFAIELVDCVRREQEYVVNTPVVVTRLFDASARAGISNFGAHVVVGPARAVFLRHGARCTG